MSDATQQRIITLLAAGIAYVISQQVTNRLIDIPEQRGIKDDILEAGRRRFMLTADSHRFTRSSSCVKARPIRFARGTVDRAR